MLTLRSLMGAALLVAPLSAAVACDDYAEEQALAAAIAAAKATRTAEGPAVAAPEAQAVAATAAMSAPPPGPIETAAHLPVRATNF